jgi:hypothetical protein
VLLTTNRPRTTLNVNRAGRKERFTESSQRRRSNSSEIPLVVDKKADGIFGRGYAEKALKLPTELGGAL